MTHGICPPQTGWVRRTAEAGAGSACDAMLQALLCMDYAVSMKRLVIIAGSAEAHSLACRCKDALVVLPAPERVERQWDNWVMRGPVTAAVLHGLGATHVVEAAHPGDVQTAFDTQKACDTLGLPRLQLVRAPWRAGRLDHWVPVADPAQLPRVIPPGARVLVATGRSVLRSLRPVQATFLVRRLGPCGPFPLRHGRYLPGQGPFSIRWEVALLRKERIDWLLVPNAGGTGAWPKLAAARQLRLPVALLARPRRPTGRRVETVEEAEAWQP